MTRSSDAFVVSMLSTLTLLTLLTAPHVARAAESFQCGPGGKPNVVTAKCDCPPGKVETTAGKVSSCVAAPKPKEPAPPPVKPKEQKEAPATSHECGPGLEYQEGKGCVAKVDTHCPNGMHLEENKGCVADVTDAVVPSGQNPPPSPPAEPATTPAAPPVPVPVAPPSHESPPPDHRDGVVFGLALGGVIPTGDLAKDQSQSTLFGPNAMLGIDVGIRFVKYVYIGAVFDYGALSIKQATDQNSNGCKSGLSCSGSILRGGLVARVYPVTKGMFDPWFGLGITRTWVKDESKLNADSVTDTLPTTDYMVQLGLDLRVLPRLTVGPMVSYSFGTYSSVDTDTTVGGQTTSTTTTVDSSQRSTHGFLFLGARGSFTL